MLRRITNLQSSPTFNTAAYSSGNFLVSIAGLISFPLITRLLTVDEYGVLNLIAVILAVLVSFGKAGLQRSIIRFSSAARSGNEQYRVSDVYLTAIMCMFCTIIVIQILWSVASQFAPLSLVGSEHLYPIFIVSGLMAFGQVLYSGFRTIFVSEKRSILKSTIEVSKRYTWIALLIPALLLADDKLMAFYVMGGLHEIAFLILSLWLCQRYFSVLSGRFDFSLLRQLAAYGIPLMGFELMNLVLALGDRAQINYYLGAREVGLYAATYNLCSYVAAIFVDGMTTAITPIYMDRWEKEGRKETEKFLATALRYYLLFAIPCAVGGSLIGHDLVVLLAGSSYTDSQGVVPFVIIGLLVNGISSIVSAGMQIKKRTGLIFAIVCGTAMLNLGLNTILIPILGIQGAAISTLLAYTSSTLLYLFFGSKILSIKLYLRPVAIYSAAAAVMAAAVLSIDMPLSASNLLLKIGGGGLVFASLVLFLDWELRRLVWAYAKPAWAALANRHS